MEKFLLTFLTAAVGVAAAVFVTLLAVSLSQQQVASLQQQLLGPQLKPWIIGSGGTLALLLLSLLLGASIETRRRWRTRKLARLLREGETLTEVALRIPPDNKDRVLSFWGKYQHWCDCVLQNLPECDRGDFQSLDRQQAPNSSDFSPLTQDQAYEVAGRVAVLKTIVSRLRG
jgi:hypothetical protein